MSAVLQQSVPCAAAFDSSEADLLICCARTSVTTAHADRIAAMLADGIDWTTLVRQALQHRVAELLSFNLRRFAADALPENMVPVLQEYSDRSQKQNLALAHELVDILQELSDRGVAAIPFKGPVLAANVYGCLSLRAAGDLDFLVREDDLSAVFGQLEARGYEANPQMTPEQERGFRKYEHARLFVRKEGSFAVEPHWAITPRTLAVHADMRGIWERAAPVAFCGTTVLAFAPEDLLAVLCIHGSKHRYERLQWICDVAELIRRYPELDWMTCLHSARAHGTERIFLLGAAVAQTVLDTKLPDVVRARLHEDMTAREMAERVRHSLFAETPPPPSLARVSQFQIRLHERFRDKAAYVLRTVLTPRLDHLQMIALPRPLSWLYVPIKLVHDYCLLPIWKVVKPALRRRDAGQVGNDAALLKARIRRAWSDRSVVWEAWGDSPNDEKQLNEPLLDAAGIEPGQRVLDLASGAGEPALSVARRVEPTGCVVAVDLVPEMVLALRRRAVALELSNIRPFAADMETLPFADEVFDRVLCHFGLMFAPRVDVALAEARRVLKPGGTAAFMVWGPIEDNSVFDVLRTVSKHFFGSPEESELDPFRFAALGSLATVLEAACFLGVEEREIRFTRTAPAGSRFWERNVRRTLGTMIDALPEATRDAFDKALAAAFECYRQRDQYVLSGHVRIGVGRAPAKSDGS